MRSIISVLMIFSFMIIFSCNKNNDKPVTGIQNETTNDLFSENDTQESDAALNTKIRILAHTMSFVLRDQKICNALSMKFSQADNKEKIIDLKKWMETKVSGKSIVARMAESGFVEKINGKAKKITKEELLSMVKSIKPGVDFYFPKDKDRGIWFNHLSDLLVAAPDVSDEWGSFPAFNLLGQKIILNAEKPPVNPVIVIIPCEHYGIHIGHINETNQQTTGGGDGSGGGYGGSGGSGGNTHPPLQDGARIKMYQMKQDVCEESWVRGDPEIRYSIKNSKNHDYLIKDENPGDKWDCTWHWDGIHHDYGWKTINHYDFFWHFNDYGNYVVYYFYESDGGTEVEKDTYTVDNATFTFERKVGDDEMGVKSVHKDDGYLEPGVDQAYDSGDMRFYIDWTNQSN